MAPGVFDHLLAVCVMVVVPILGARSRQGLEQLIAERGSAGRRSLYLRIITWQWSLAGAAVALWMLTARAWSAIGLSWRVGWGFAVVLALTVATLGYLARQLQRVRRSPELAAKVRADAANVLSFLPSTPGELRLFALLCVTAGVVEELLFRGYILWYLSAAMPMWVAILASSLAFGIGHLYQGRLAGLQTGVLALIVAGLYMLSGSLWLPMLLHGAGNYLQARLIYDARRIVSGAPEATAVPREAPAQGV